MRCLCLEAKNSPYLAGRLGVDFCCLPILQAYNPSAVQTIRRQNTMRAVKALVLLTTLVFLPAAYAQETLTPQQALARVVQQSPAQAQWFTAEFLAQVPTAQIDNIVRQYTGQFGKFQRADATADGFTVVLERGTFPAKIGLDSQGRIAGLWFGLAQPAKALSLDETIKQFAALPGKVSVLVLEDGKPRASLHPQDALAVGSAFKLAILAALQDDVAAGRRRYEEVVQLRPEWKSLPHSVLLNWPDNTPITLASLANEMISISDNTAADALLSILGREAVERHASRNMPFLSTRQVFVLKAPSNSALLARYRAADAPARRALLPEIDRQPMPEAKEFGVQPAATDIEWFFTAGELCSLVAKVADAPAMRINPGFAKKEEWKQVAFKGGSEPGVLNLTTALAGLNGKRFCVAATWNNAESLDQGKFFTLYSGILSSLATESAK